MSFNQLASDVDVKVEANLEASVKVGENITGSGSESAFLGIFRRILIFLDASYQRFGAFLLHFQ